MKTHRLVSRERLKRWLARNKTRRFKRACSYSCVIAAYLHANGSPDARVRNYSLTPVEGADALVHPKWLAKLIADFDFSGHGAEFGTGATALRLLEPNA